jgi:protein involved in sex pheromone biosynthesis
MLRKTIIGAVLASVVLMSGCASVPMAPKEADAALKTFKAPSEEKAALYIYRNSFVGQALKKTVTLDGVVVGETANKVYFYKEIAPGEHTLATESEFSDNTLTFTAAPGKTYFAEQYIKMGVFVGGAALRMVDEEAGKKGVSECSLAQQ